MRGLYRYIGLAISLLLICLGYALFLPAARKMQSVKYTIDILYENTDTGTNFSVDDIDEITDKLHKGARFDTEITGLTQESNRSIQNETNLQEIPIDLITYYGNISNSFPVEFVVGSFPIPDGGNVCAIDSDTAYKLWGSVDVQGLTLKYDGDEYTVAGVFKHPRHIMLRPFSNAFTQKDGKLFSLLRLRLPSYQNTGEAGRNFIQSYTGGRGSIRDLSPLYMLAEQLLLVPFVILLVAVVIKHARRRKLLYALPSLFMIGLCFSFIKIYADVPLYLIPTKWSDFEFWPRTAEFIKQSYYALVDAPSLHIFTMQITSIRKMLLSGSCAIVGAVITAIYYIRSYNRNA